MSYMALYRKFRPQEFSEVKGQDHIVTTLKNQIKTNRIGHAYLFTGTRGTGKTTMAKLFAKAVNCENPLEDGSPCGECACCKAANDGNSLNVIELDAAAHNGVDDIRQIIEEVAYPPSQGKYKVYIVDEVHELSGSAFNAFLKTLEEPPSYVIFILATTEVHKIPITIMSRVQRYDFRRISIETISARLRELCDAEEITVEDKALNYIAKVGDGSMRDSISLLDQCIAFYIGEDLTYDKVLKTLGAVDTEIFSKLLRAVIHHNANEAISIVEEVVILGRELEQFVMDFIWYLRNLMLLSGGEHMEDALDMSSENLALLKEESAMVELDVILRYIRVMSELLGQMKYSSQKRVLLEIAIVKLCSPQTEEDFGSILDRLNALEDKMEEGIPMAVAPQSGAGMPQATEPIKKKEFPKAVPEEVKKTLQEWKHFLAELDSGLVRAALQKAKPTVEEDGSFIIVFDAHDSVQKTNYDTCSNFEGYLKSRLNDFMQLQIPLKLVLNNSGVSSDRIYPDALSHFAEENDVKIDVEDF
ncbi:MAG: DNA polymerase III subunit gamma/tau [Lachnospiraceae bacterium]|nr:DNA polymerase III subunit gamma/tau [Lachnospiraceae bacterium]